MSRDMGSGVKIAQGFKSKKQGEKEQGLWQAGILASHHCRGSGRHQEALKHPKMPRRSKGMRNSSHASTDFKHKLQLEKFKHVRSQHVFLEKWQ